MSKNYSDRVKCKSCENGSGPSGCTDCLNTGHDPMAFAGGIDAALNDAYAEGRKDEAESHSRAARDVLAERERQQSAEGWTPEHDDEHTDRSLAFAAASYAYNAAISHEGRIWNTALPPTIWPQSWGADAWKPKSRRRDLIRAAALMIAEIERLDRCA